MSEGGEGQQPKPEPKPFRGVGEDISVLRDRFERMLAISPNGLHQEVRANEDGSKTVMRFLEKPLYGQDDRRSLAKLRESAALAGVREAFAPLVLPGETGDPVVQLGYEETIPRDALPGPLQDLPWSRLEDETTKNTPL